MSSFSNNKKRNQLGMSVGKANNILKKNLLFSLVQKLGLDFCYRCGKKIETVDEFSVEHKVNWLDSENPIELFFDLGNIDFSHIKCNIGAVRKEYLIQRGKEWSKNNIITCPEEMAPCSTCKEIKPLTEFHKDKVTLRGVHSECKECREIARKSK